nr:MAG TPA: hypothetical protein [Caudoviricetes sp.]
MNKQELTFPKLRIVINYEGTHFYTIDEDYRTRQHESLEQAQEYLCHKYNIVTSEINVETKVQFTY